MQSRINPMWRWDILIPLPHPKNENSMKYYNVRYSITLNDQQLDYLSDEDQDINRMKCFKTLVRLASMEPSTVSMKNFSAGMSIGQFAISKVELARLWNCDRKTATRIIKEFNDMDIITSFANNRTTIHTLNCISIWFTSSGCIRNPHFRSNPKVKVKTKEPKPRKKPPRVPPGKASPIAIIPADSNADEPIKSSFSLLSDGSVCSDKDMDSPVDDSSFEGNSSESIRNDIAKDGKQISTADYGASSSAHCSESESKESRAITEDSSSRQSNEREQESE